MANFLDEFNDKNYQKKQNQKREDASNGEMDQGSAVSDQKEIQTKTTSEATQKQQFRSKANTNSQIDLTKNEEIFEEVTEDIIGEDLFQAVEIDTQYSKNKKRKQLLIAAGTTILALSCILVFFFTQQVKMPDWTNKPVSDMGKWAIQNKLKMTNEEIYDKTIDEGNVVETKVKPGKKIWKGKSFAAIVSKGADPEESVPLPDFSKMTESLIKQWIEDEKATNVKIIQEFNDTVKKGAYLKTTFRSQDTNAQNYKRKDYATIYVSKGKEVFEKNIVVPDFKGKMKAEVESWAKEQQVEVEYNDVDSTDENIGQVISQSVAAKEKVAKHDKMSVDISIGKAAVVPWFGSMLKADAMAYNKDGLMVRTTEQYSTSVAYGEMIYQSVSEGTRLTGTDKEVEVVYSLGKPYMEDLSGRTENTIPEYFYQFKAGGINVSYTIHYENNPDVPRGTIIRNTNTNTYIGDGWHVDIYVSN